MIPQKGQGCQHSTRRALVFYCCSLLLWSVPYGMQAKTGQSTAIYCSLSRITGSVKENVLPTPAVLSTRI